jgi:AraC-like DNA-binding protein
MLDALSIEEIANRVGYSDKGHFARQFTKIVGVSPHRYRLDVS